jgi:hypothetical protein
MSAPFRKETDLLPPRTSHGVRRRWRPRPNPTAPDTSPPAAGAMEGSVRDGARHGYVERGETCDAGVTWCSICPRHGVLYKLAATRCCDVSQRERMEEGRIMGGRRAGGGGLGDQGGRGREEAKVEGGGRPDPTRPDPFLAAFDDDDDDDGLGGIGRGLRRAAIPRGASRGGEFRTTKDTVGPWRFTRRTPSYWMAC